eukprot:CAMPEP_0117446146 /NCGR_PEP_ID=MMETSP0759-20121206/6174_1 /TAXON_ID=63605 /ORGANISM="Percolomonas cosmopolitus, Strain WS" /LENGTH=614 /DNA_ID=CAMNT_0005238371 /DNA_START=128 /DNA_END=1972 /DNA_ORIENTATION=-
MSSNSDALSSNSSSNSYINSTSTQLSINSSHQNVNDVIASGAPNDDHQQFSSQSSPQYIDPELLDETLSGITRHRMDRGGSQNGSSRNSDDDEKFNPDAFLSDSGLDENDELRGGTNTDALHHTNAPPHSQSSESLHHQNSHLSTSIKTHNDLLERKLKRMSVQKELQSTNHDGFTSEPLSDDLVQWIHKDVTTSTRRKSENSTRDRSHSQPAPSISVSGTPKSSTTSTTTSHDTQKNQANSRRFYRSGSSDDKMDSPKRVGFQIMKKYEGKQIREEKRSKLKQKTEYSSNITHKMVSPYQVKLLWQEAPKHVFIAPNNYNAEVRKYFANVVEYLYDERQCMVIVEPEVKEGYPEFDYLLSWKDDKEKAYVLKSVDLAICMGGDGTVLHCVRQFLESCPPVLGFGMGSIGFLTLFDVRKYRSIISKVLAKSIHISTRARLTCMIERHDGSKDSQETYQVMNELVCDRGPSPYLTSLDTFCNGKLITNVQADGLIVATPNGSSAYNMSAGGSIVHPSVVCMLLTPICPHSLSFRPIILPDSVKLKIQVPHSARTSAYLSFDGSNRQELRKGDSVHIETSEWPVPLIVTNDATSAWFRDLSESFGWSKRKQQRAWE